MLIGKWPTQTGRAQPIFHTKAGYCEVNKDIRGVGKIHFPVPAPAVTLAKDFLLRVSATRDPLSCGLKFP